jgi:hypothetical protein
MDDDVCESRTQQNDEHDVADAANNPAAANVVTGKRRKNARRMRGVRHRLPGSMNSGIGRSLKPKELEKVAKKNAHKPKR